jgi:hypothetical protein
MADPTPEWEAVPPKKPRKNWMVAVRGPLGGKGSIGGACVLWDVATIHNGAPGNTLQTQEEIAHIMAASKELLAACQMALASLQCQEWLSFDETINTLAAAVRKAKGVTP